jgi:hypothetical protein
MKYFLEQHINSDGTSVFDDDWVGFYKLKK